MVRIPERTKEMIDNYAKQMWRPGGFVAAVLENNLREAFGRADSPNRAVMEQIVKYVYNNVPQIAWGSPGAVQRWLSQKDVTIK